MSWEVSELSAIARIGDGAHASLKRVKGGIPYLTAKNITKTGIDYSNLEYIAQETYDKHFKEKSSALTKPIKGDILYSIIGSIGGVYVVRDEILGISSSVAIFRANSNIIIPEYLAYFFKSASFDAQIQSIKGGVAQGFMSLGKLGTVKISYPKDIEYQKQIVKVLSAYDVLIENNQKQIKLLEEAAQRLYKEWFVDLHFPGYKNTPIVDGVPEGWKRETVAECLLSHTNGGWGKETSIGKYIHLGKVIRGTDISDIKAGHCDNVPVRYHTDSDIQKKKLCVDDIVFELSNGNINNIGRNLFIDKLILKNIGEDTICASFCKLLRPKDRMHALILYFEIQDMQSSGRMLPYKKHGANGINNFDFDGFLKHSLLIPNDAALLKQFKTIMFKISNIQGQIPILIEARDRLLPKLMSGELEV